MQSSTDYRSFKFLNENRDVNRGHVEALKRSFAQNGNFTEVVPVLVNENMEIIDGQHRFVAAKELGERVYFNQIEGLRVQDARTMNVLQRNWTITDFARSYAPTNPNYRQYLQWQEEYGFSNSILFLCIFQGADSKGKFKKFRGGEFVIPDMEGAKKCLDLVAEAQEFTPLASNRGFVSAMLKIRDVENFDFDQFLNKVRQYGSSMLHPYESQIDNLRQIETLYNHRQAEGNRIRLF